MTTAPDVLSVLGAKKQFGDIAALDGATFDLRQGEMLALLGPNGAGKTTLIRAISGRVRLDSGEIRILGNPLGAAGERAGRTPPQLGIVPQEIALYPLLTPRENLHAFGRMQGMGGPDLAARIEWALALTALDDRAKDVVKGFSGGMKRRLNIACGVLHRPGILLLDEPTVGVDPQSRERIYEMLSAPVSALAAWPSNKRPRQVPKPATAHRERQYDGASRPPVYWLRFATE